MNNKIKGLLYMMSSALCLCIMSGLIKYAQIDSYKSTFFRFAIGLTLLGTLAISGKIKLKFNHSPLLLLRGLLGGGGIFLFFLGILELGVSKATVLFYAYPIFAAILSAVFLKEKLSLQKIIAILAAFVGIYFLSAKTGTSLSIGFYEILVVLGAVLSAGAVVTVKKLHETDSTYAILFAQCVVGAWISVLPANITPCDIGYIGGFLLIGIGISATVGQLLLTEAYKHMTVTTGSLLLMTVPIMNFFLGIAIFSETITVNAFIGSGIIITSCIAIIVFDKKKTPINKETSTIKEKNV